MSIPQCFTFTVECVALRDFKEVCSDYCSLRLLPFFGFSKSTLSVFSAIFCAFFFWRFAVLVPFDFDAKSTNYSIKNQTAQSKYDFDRQAYPVCKADTLYHRACTMLRVYAIVAAKWWGTKAANCLFLWI